MSHTWESQIASSSPEPYLLSKSRPPLQAGAKHKQYWFALLSVYRDLEVLLATFWPHILVSSFVACLRGSFGEYMPLREQDSRGV